MRATGKTDPPRLPTSMLPRGLVALWLLIPGAAACGSEEVDDAGVSDVADDPGADAGGALDMGGGAWGPANCDAVETAGMGGVPAFGLLSPDDPAPSRILLTGNSAGGFGTHMALPSVRKLYPDSCDTCIGDDGHLTDYHAYQLAEDPNLRMGFMSTERDGVIVERSPIDAPTFEAALLEAMAELREAFPDRFRSFFAAGDGHTFILGDFEREVGGTSVRAWITDMLEGGESWISVSD